jgi:hypothetical protein
MRVNVVQAWTAASLLVAALMMGGAATANRCRAGADNGPHLLASSARVDYGAALAGLPSARRPEVGRAANRRAAAMLVVMLAQRAQLGGLAR